jgi:thiamine-monophosphate kinase
MSASEDELIAVICAACPHPAPPAGPGDDAAILQDSPGRRVLTCDALIEGTHFLRAHPPWALGFKTLMVNLSDLAAMGAVSEAFVLTVGLPRDVPLLWWRRFAEGLGDAARAAGVVLAGGDTVRSDCGIALSVTAWGRLAGALALTRAGGLGGDRLLVKGQVGRSGLGLERWRAGAAAVDRWPEEGAWRGDRCVEHHLAPELPLEAGPWALEHGAHAGMDCSDGLTTDLPRLAAASGVRLVVDLADLPDDPACAGFAPQARASAGEDYGLLVLVPPAREGAFLAYGFHALGRAAEPSEAGPEVTWLRAGEPQDPAGWPRFEHFPPGGDNMARRS